VNDVFDLAAQFMADAASCGQPWDAALREWSARHDLTVLELRELRRAVLRRRLFGARPAANTDCCRYFSGRRP
jgi:hypothetical protein